MDYILIVLEKKAFSLFDVFEDGSSKPFLVDGERELPNDKLAGLVDKIKEIENEDSLSDVAFDIINATGSTDSIKTLISGLLPCAALQILALPQAVAELFVKRALMRPGVKVTFAFDGLNYAASMDVDGKISVAKSADAGLMLNASDFTDLYAKGFSGCDDSELLKERKTFETREAALNVEKERLSQEKKDLEKKVSLLTQEIEEKKTAKLTKEELKKRRVEIRLTDYMAEQSVRVFYTVKDGAAVKKYEKILTMKGDNISYYLDGYKYEGMAGIKKYRKENLSATDEEQPQTGKNSVATPMAGIVYCVQDISDVLFFSTARNSICDFSGKDCIKEENLKYNRNRLLAIVADPADDPDEVREYLNETVRKESSHNVD